MPASERFDHVLTAARSGEDWALAALYRSLQPGLLGYLRGQRPREAEDIASETWITVARGLATFRGSEDDFRRWVFATARRRLLDLARSQKRRPQSVSSALATGEAELTSPDAETEALAALGTREVLELVAALSPKEAEVILLRVIGGLSAQDVAAITGRSTASVRVLQHRALGRLANVLRTTLVTLQSRLAL